RVTAIALLKLYPGAQAFTAAGVETIANKLHELAPRNYGMKTAQQLVTLAQQSTSSGLASSARSTSLKLLCDQLEHTQVNLAQLKGRSIPFSPVTKKRKDCKVCLNLDTRQLLFCEPNSAMSSDFTVLIKWSPMQGW